MEKVDEYLDKIKKTYNVTFNVFSIKEFDFSSSMKLLDRLDIFLKSWNYSGYNISVEPYLYIGKEHKEKTKGIFVDESEKKIIIK